MLSRISGGISKRARGRDMLAVGKIEARRGCRSTARCGSQLSVMVTFSWASVATDT